MNESIEGFAISARHFLRRAYGMETLDVISVASFIMLEANV